MDDAVSICRVDTLSIIHSNSLLTDWEIVSSASGLEGGESDTQVVSSSLFRMSVDVPVIKLWQVNYKYTCMHNMYIRVKLNYEFIRWI